MIFKEHLFDKKNILIVGASSGLGQNLGLELLRLGASVTGMSRTIEHKSFVLKTEKSISGSFEAIKIDLNDSFFDFENLNLDVHYDGIFFSAGISKVSNFISTSDNAIDEMFKVNVLGQIKLLRFLLKKKLLKKQASIIFMSSINGTSLGSKGHSIYAATKGALNGITMSLANELSKRRIRVNSIAAGLVKTPMFDDNMRIAGESVMGEYENTYPLGFGESEDITNLAIFLLSDASKWITGQTHIIDGGHSIS